ncbi:MAG: type II toxin-antitoxin system VapC family toxin [Lachnospiraceae bacterium]|nr:type II toxin-antitoxin system VapC family toxin [Lachnospiraceae bacterium]MBQ6544609.1 type II toxin-antitoxin system VapC family toxin [Lachnospiraceae bacterium]
MKFLLDTHVLLWWVVGDPRVEPVRKTVENPANEVYYSAASIWEIAIKHSIGRLRITPGEARREFENAGFAELEITAGHAAAVGDLPYREDHKDPFDRMLIVQAQEEQMDLISADSKFGGYSGFRLVMLGNGGTK